MRILVTDGMDKTALAQLKANGHEVLERLDRKSTRLNSSHP